MHRFLQWCQASADGRDEWRRQQGSIYLMLPSTKFHTRCEPVLRVPSNTRLQAARFKFGKTWDEANPGFPVSQSHFILVLSQSKKLCETNLLTGWFASTNPAGWSQWKNWVLMPKRRYSTEKLTALSIGQESHILVATVRKATQYVSSVHEKQVPDGRSQQKQSGLTCFDKKMPNS